MHRKENGDQQLPGGKVTKELLNGYRVSVLQDEGFGDWLNNNVNLPNTADCTLSMS